MDSWQGIALQAAFWGFGFLGLFGITLLPWRSLQLLRRSWSPTCASVLGRICFLLLVLAAALALVAAVACTYDVSRCLLGYHCSANRAGGWMYLAGVGFWYAAVVLVAFIVLFVVGKLGRVAT